MQNRIREIRLQKGLTLEQLADRLGGVHFTTVGKMETGKMEITLSRLYSLAEALDVSVSELFSSEVEADRAGTLPVKYLRRGDTIETGLVVEHMVLRGYEQFPHGDVIVQSVSFKNLSDLKGLMRESHFLVRSDGFGLLPGMHYAVKNQKGDIYLAEYAELPARFIQPAVGTKFKEMILGQDQLVILGMCLTWEVGLVAAVHPSELSKSGKD